MIRFVFLALVLYSFGCASDCEKPRVLARYAEIGRQAELLECMEAEQSWVREETARRLGRLRSDVVREKLEATLLDRSERPWVRAAAADGLATIGHPGSFDVLAGVLATPGLDPEPKVALIEALCRFTDRSEDAVQSIAPHTDDEDLIVAALARKKVGSKCTAR